MNAPLARSIRVASDYVVPACLLVLIPVLLVGYWLDHNAKVRTYTQQLAACDRGNLLRIRINTKFAVYDRAFEKAAATLTAATTPVGKELHDVLSTAAATAPEPLPLTMCRKIYQRPEWFWQ